MFNLKNGEELVEIVAFVIGVTSVILEVLNSDWLISIFEKVACRIQFFYNCT